MPVLLAKAEKDSSCSAPAATTPTALASIGFRCSSCFKCLQPPPSPALLLPAAQAADAPGRTSP